MQLYCVSLALGDDETSAEAPPLGPPTTLRLDVRGTVAAHLISSPFGGSGDTRIDGARCERSRVMMLQSAGEVPVETGETPSLQDPLDVPSRKRSPLDALREAPVEPPEETAQPDPTARPDPGAPNAPK